MTYKIDILELVGQRVSMGTEGSYDQIQYNESTIGPLAAGDSGDYLIRSALKFNMPEVFSNPISAVLRLYARHINHTNNVLTDIGVWNVNDLYRD